MNIVDKKLRIVVVGRCRDKNYMESKLLNDVIPECLRKFTDCSKTDIMFCISSYFSGVGPIVKDFGKEYRYPVKEFPIDWSKGRGGITTTNDVMLEFARGEHRTVVVAFYNGYGADANVVSKASLLTREIPEEIILKDYRIRY